LRGIFELKKSALRRTKKKIHQRVLIEQHLEKRDGFIWLLKKETFWHSPTYFKEDYGFHNPLMDLDVIIFA